MRSVTGQKSTYAAESGSNGTQGNIRESGRHCQADTERKIYFLNGTATTENYTLSQLDALPFSRVTARRALKVGATCPETPTSRVTEATGGDAKPTV